MSTTLVRIHKKCLHCLGDDEYTILPGNIAKINIGGMSVLKKEQTLPGTDVVNDQLEENKIIV